MAIDADEYTSFKRDMPTGFGKGVGGAIQGSNNVTLERMTGKTTMMKRARKMSMMKVMKDNALLITVMP